MQQQYHKTQIQHQKYKNTNTKATKCKQSTNTTTTLNILILQHQCHTQIQQHKCRAKILNRNFRFVVLLLRLITNNKSPGGQQMITMTQINVRRM